MYYHLSDADWQLQSVWLWPPNPRFNVLVSLRTLEIKSLLPLPQQVVVQTFELLQLRAQTAADSRYHFPAISSGTVTNHVPLDTDASGSLLGRDPNTY